MLETIGEGPALVLVGLAGGIMLGLAARLGRFCTLGALEDLVLARDPRRARMWLAAIGAAVLGTQALMASGAMNPQDTVYLTQAWSPLASVLGGLAFGYGMAMAGYCGHGALARLGGGDLRALVIVGVMGISALVAVSGPLAGLRLALFPEAVETAPAGLVPPVLGMALGVALLVAAGMGPRRVWVLGWGGLAGLAIVLGWAGTLWVAQTGFAPEAPRSHNFAAPLGEGMLWLMTSTGREAGFAIGSVSGVLIGAMLGSLIRGSFQWEACDDPRELRRQMGGAALMGVGAVVAFGCSVGQGLSAMSVLSASAPVTLLAIGVGDWLGLRRLVWVPA
jgi:uncharacterized membrane protein YedE/YeeE